jgi:hypothetical protein
VVQRHRIDVGVDPAGSKQRGRAGSKTQYFAALRDIERLDAETIAREHDAPAVALDNRKANIP